ncbi:MAG: CpsD/CapB family tyrosine-protein kinase [Clostridia bacterium]|nr:CpsD/CapB family tyrosine-protein kinase [Clostridia bacterium]
MNKLTLEPLESIDSREKEMFRTLRTNIEFTGIENQVITITSCYPNDGKTTVSYNLACAFAESGKKTLLIDGDLRKSIFMSRYKIQQEVRGLSHLLSGQNTLEDVLYETNIQNLHVILTGVFPMNPTELLGNQRFDALLSSVRHRFEYIIIDTPPIGSVIDAAVTAKQSDASLLVLASDTVSRGEARRIVSQLKNANSNILGVVLNKVDSKSGGYYYGKRYKGYNKYGYGYE